MRYDYNGEGGTRRRQETEVGGQMRKFLAGLKSKTINKLGYSQILENLRIARGDGKSLWVRREQVAERLVWMERFGVSLVRYRLQVMRSIKKLERKVKLHAKKIAMAEVVADKLYSRLFAYLRKYANGGTTLIAKKWFRQNGRKLAMASVAMNDGGRTSISIIERGVRGTTSNMKKWIRHHGRKLATAWVAVVLAIAMVPCTIWCTVVVGLQPPVPTKALTNSVA